MIDSEERKQLLHNAASLMPVLRIGKSGLTPGMVAEVKRQVEQRQLVKIKLLRAATEAQDRHALAATLAASADAELVHFVGSIVILAKKPGREHPVPAKHRGSRFPEAP